MLIVEGMPGLLRGVIVWAEQMTMRCFHKEASNGEKNEEWI